MLNKSFFTQDDRLLPRAALSALIPVMALALSGCARNVDQTVAFPLGPAGASVTSTFEVPEKQLYAFSLRYHYREGDEADRARMWALAGGSQQEGPGRWVEPGAPLRIKIAVTRTQEGREERVMEQIVGNPHLSSWGAAALNAELAATALEPGRYAVTAVSLDVAPSFAGASTTLHIGVAYRGK